MAINKSKELQNGVIVNYHRIVRAPALPNSSDASMVEVICEEFLSKSDKDNGKSAVSACAYQIEMSKSEVESTSVFAKSYEKLMALPEFDGAIEE